MNCFPDEPSLQLIPDRFKSKVMIVTGAASGIGRATAIRAAKEGAKVVVVDLNLEKANATVQEILSAGGEAISLCYDLTKKENTDEMITKVHEHFGRLDICINNAGISPEPKRLHLLTQKEIDLSVKVNIYATLYCCMSEICYFLEQNAGGIIVNTASIAGLTGVPNNPCYAMTKHAVNGLTRALAIDYAKNHIRINSVNPGPVMTEMVKKLNEQQKNTTEVYERDKWVNVQHRMSTPEEQAASILYLASNDASHITATLFATDGGWTAY